MSGLVQGAQRLRQGGADVRRRALAAWSRSRRRLPLVFHALAVLGVLAALMVPASPPVARELVLVRDVSASVMRASGARLPAAAEALARDADRVYTVLVGRRARLIPADRRRSRPWAVRLDARGAVGESATCLAAGLIRAGAIPCHGPTRRRLLLVSDGLETSGDGAAAARSLAGRVLIEAAATGAVPEPDCVAVRLRVPARVRVGVPCSMALLARSTSVLTARVELSDGERVCAVARATLTPAGVEVPLRVTFSRPGLHLPTARVIAFAGGSGDAVPENDRARAAVLVAGPARVLWVGERPPAWAAAASGIRITHARELAAGAVARAGGNLVVLDDLPRSRLAPGVCRELKAAVSEGAGLVVFGGTRSLGPGGYGRPLVGDIPMADLLPARMEPMQSLGLVVLLDVSGSMGEPAPSTGGEVSKLSLAVAAVMETWSRLVVGDQAGLAVFADEFRPLLAVKRVDELHRDERMRRLRALLLRARAGGGTRMLAAMGRACAMLDGVRARRLHLIVVTDGDTEEKRAEVDAAMEVVARRVKTLGLGISVVTVGKEPDRRVLGLLRARVGAEVTGVAGREIMLSSVLARNLQRARSYLRRGSRVAVVAPHPVTSGLAPAALPPLVSLVAVGPEKRDRGALALLADEQGQPLAAAWNLGLGRVALFTGAPWRDWGWQPDAGARALLRQALDWAGAGAGAVQARVVVDGGFAVVRVRRRAAGAGRAGVMDARPWRARFTRIEVAGRGVAQADGDADHQGRGAGFELALTPSAWNTWQARARVDPGFYRIDIRRAGEVLARLPLLVEERDEWLRFGVDGTALARMAAAGGGGIIASRRQALPWEQVPLQHAGSRPRVSPLLLGTALVLFLLGLAAGAWR